jgi:urease accessory protein
MQMDCPSRTDLAPQRVDARGRLSVRRLDGRTRVSRLYQEGAAKIRMPRSTGDPLEAVLINTAGGLTGGDRLEWSIDVGIGASAVVTTQACEKVYRAAEGQAQVSCALSVGPRGRLAWLPQETIVFHRAAFSRNLTVDLADSSEALIVEATVFGRLAMGEIVRRALFRDRWRVCRNGKLVHAEEFFVGPELAATLSLSAVTGGAVAVATVLLVADDAEDRLDTARELIGEGGAVSAWTVAQSGKLLARLYAGDGYSLRKRLVPLIGLLNGQAGLPKLWSL